MLDALVDTLLYEGYALYPYTPGATKNATPTPFGIVYPPVYAAGSGATFDHLQIECVCSAAIRGVAARSTSCRRAGCATRARRAASSCPRCAPARQRTVRSTSTACAAAPRSAFADGRMTIRVENHTEVPAGPRPRGEALRHSLLSTHVVGRVDGGRFVSPLEADGLRAHQLVAGARHAGGRRRARRRDHAPRPPADRAREQGQPVRLDRDRGGAADPRARALRRGARGGRGAGPGGAADARARGADDAAGADGPPRARAGRRPARGRAVGRGRRRASTGAATRSCCGRRPTRRRRTTSSRAAGRRSSASTTTTTAPCTSPSPSTTSPGRTLMRDIGRYLYFKTSEVEVPA